MNNQNVYLVGPRYHHHSKYSGYESFGRYCQTIHLNSPMRSRFLSHRLGEYPWIGDLGWRIDETITAIVPRPLYSLGIFLIEVATSLHMLVHKQSLYHVLYGETDIWLLNYVKRFTGNLLVGTFHEPSFSLKWLETDRIATHLDAVIIVSEYQRSYFEKIIPQERIFVVPHGVDTNFFQPSAQLTQEPICVTVGSHLRDFKTFQAAIDIVLQANPKVRFMAIGTNTKGGGNSRLEDDRVEFLENVSDAELRETYQRARVAIFPFKEATANNSLLEAMACGLPIVATNVGGVPEYINSDAGFLCPQYDSESMAKGILNIIENNSLATQMGASSRSQALKFDYQITAEQMNQVYSKIVLKH